MNCHHLFFADTFIRPMYAGNVLGKVAIKDPTKRKVLSVRPTSFDKAPLTAVAEVITTKVEGFNKAKWVGESVSESDRPDLQSANTVVSGGRGIKVCIVLYILQFFWWRLACIVAQSFSIQYLLHLHTQLLYSLAKTLSFWKNWPTNSMRPSVPRGRPSMPDFVPMIGKWGKRARWWHPIYTLRRAFPGPFNI